MIKKLVSHLGEYKAASIKTPLFAALEAIMDVLLPTIMAFIIDQGIEKGDMNAIIRYGLLTFLVAAIALVLGVLAGKYAAEASTGFAGNLRDAMYENIQHYSFSNIDKFSTAGLVTRMTTDVTNVQNAFQMILRMCVRAPVHLVFAMFMAVVIGGPLSLVFVVAVVFLVAVLAAIMIPTFRIFDRVFKNYDNLNASVQENVSAIRVVKSFVREGFENEKYTAACESLYKQFVNAESRLSFNNPAMLVAVYGCNIALSWFGAKYVLHGAITTGQLNALFGYVMNILMALMMLSMAFVMIAMSAASAKRIVEVLDEHTDLPPAKQPVQQVADGSIQFDHVTFKYKHGSGQPVLNDISFTIRPGETLGIIGGTGSAKSSLVQLIPRLYDAESGTAAQTLVTDSDGKATVYVKRGSYTLTATHERFTSAITQTTSVSSGRTVKMTGEILETVQLVVTNEYGAPLSGAAVSIGGKTITTGADGTASFSVKRGSYVAQVACTGYKTQAVQLSVTGSLRERVKLG